MNVVVSELKCRVCLKVPKSYINIATAYDGELQVLDNNRNAEVDIPNNKNKFTYFDCLRECFGHEYANYESEDKKGVLCCVCALELRLTYAFILKALHSDKLLRHEALSMHDDAKFEIADDGTEYLAQDQSLMDQEEETTDYKDMVSYLEDQHGNGDSTKFNNQEECVNSESECLEELEMVDCESEVFVTDALQTYRTKLEIVSNAPKSEASPENIEPIKQAKEEELELNATESADEQNSENCDYPLTCTICNRRYKWLKSLRRHIRRWHPEVEKELGPDAFISKETQFSCHLCFNSYTEYVTLEKHMLTHGQEALEELRNMRKTASMEKGKEEIEHVEIDETQSCEVDGDEDSLGLTCDICKGVFSNRTAMEQHNCLKHKKRTHPNALTKNKTASEESQDGYLCHICCKSFPLRRRLLTHLRIHNTTPGDEQRKKKINDRRRSKRYTCNICGQQFASKHYIELIHMEEHKEDRTLYTCNVCDKSFLRPNTLKLHMRIHNGKGFTCETCGKVFVRQNELRVHMRFHTREYPYKCEECGKKFAIKGHLTYHELRHKGLKPKCQLCGKVYTSTKALEDHMYTHSKMPFPCAHCNKSYPSISKYRAHLSTVHSIELSTTELRKATGSDKPRKRKKICFGREDSLEKEPDSTKIDEEEDF